MVLETQRRHKSLVGTSFNGCPAFELLAAGEADWRHCAGDTAVKARNVAEEGFAGLQLSSCGSTRGVYEAHAALDPACLKGHLERPPEIMTLKSLTPSGFHLTSLIASYFTLTRERSPSSPRSKTRLLEATAREKERSETAPQDNLEICLKILAALEPRSSSEPPPQFFEICANPSCVTFLWSELLGAKSGAVKADGPMNAGPHSDLVGYEAAFWFCKMQRGVDLSSRHGRGSDVRKTGLKEAVNCT